MKKMRGHGVEDNCGIFNLQMCGHSDFSLYQIYYLKECSPSIFYICAERVATIHYSLLTKHLLFLAEMPHGRLLNFLGCGNFMKKEMCELGKQIALLCREESTVRSL